MTSFSDKRVYGSIPSTAYESMEMEFERQLVGIPKEQQLNIKYPWMRRGVMLVALCVIPALIFVVSSRQQTIANVQITQDLEADAFLVEFDEFKTKFGRDYQTTEEHDRRFKVFQQNMKLAQLRNELEAANGGTAVHGVTRFSDLTDSETKIYLSSTFSEDDSKVVKKVSSSESSAVTGLTDWRGKFTTDVRNTNACGSCFAMVALMQLESDALRLQLTSNGVQFPSMSASTWLSIQQVVDCDTVIDVCSGGNDVQVVRWASDAGGLVLDKEYPYIATRSTCQFPNPAPRAYMSAVRDVISLTSVRYNEAALADYVMNTGPVAVGIAGTKALSYTGGILASCTASETMPDHSIQVVGVYLDANPDLSYWILQNAWGTAWGEAGFMKMKYGVNMCGIVSYSPYVTQPVYIPQMPTSQPTKSPAADFSGSAGTITGMSYRQIDKVTSGSWCQGVALPVLPAIDATSVTVSMWVTVVASTLTGVQNLFVVGQNPRNTAYQAYFYLDAGYVSFRDYCFNSFKSTKKVVSSTAGVRNHVVWVKNVEAGKVTVRMYLNSGAETTMLSGSFLKSTCATTPDTYVLYPTSYSSYGSDCTSSTPNAASGDIDNLMVFNRALSSTEVTNLFNSQLNYGKPTAAPVAKPSAKPTALPTAKPSTKPTQQPITASPTSATPTLGTSTSVEPTLPVIAVV